MAIRLPIVPLPIVAVVAVGWKRGTKSIPARRPARRALEYHGTELLIQRVRLVILPPMLRSDRLDPPTDSDT